MRVRFLLAVAIYAATLVNVAAAAPPDGFPVRWPSEQPSVFPAPPLPPSVPLDPAPTPPASNPWLSAGVLGADTGTPQDCLSCMFCPDGYVWAESLFMTRTNGNASQPLLVDAVPKPSQTLLSTDDLDFNWAPGLRAGAGYRLNDRWYLDFGYLGLYNSHASTSYEGTGMALPGDIGEAIGAFLRADHVQIDYWSNLNSVEANLLWCDCCCSRDPCTGINCGRSFECFGGVRYINLNERLNMVGTYELSEVPCFGAYDVYTNNNLLGPQLGVRSRFCRGRFGGEVTGKAGIFGNEATEKQTMYSSPVADSDRPLVTGTGVSVAFAGELNLTAIYQLTKTWNVRAGYNLLWLDGVALAPNQVDFSYTTEPLSGSQLNHDGSVFYHGASVGLEARW